MPFDMHAQAVALVSVCLFMSGLISLAPFKVNIIQTKCPGCGKDMTLKTSKEIYQVTAECNECGTKFMHPLH